jgi:predicted TIM-barrel fold metal-dependent hydrolase
MIIDAHAHMITAGMFKGMAGARPRNVPQKMADSLQHSVSENTGAWLEAMDRLNIEKTIFMSTASLNDEFASFINSSERFVGFARMNPTLPDAVDTLKKEMAMGMKGVKLYATSGEFNVGAREAWPFYEYCEKNEIPITIHFGVTIGPTADLYTGNPIHVSRVLSEFPELKVAIAHFGAGFFREALMLKYKRENLYIESSGTNNWLPHQDNFLTLKDIFRKSVDVFGIQHVMFGTDTRIFPDGYREHILKQQQEILKELNLRESETEDIMYNNANRFLGLHK